MRGCKIISLLPQVPKVRIAVRSTAVLSSSSGCPANRLWVRSVYSHRALLLSITLRGNTSKRRRNNIGRPWLDDGHFLLLLILSLPVYWTFGFFSLCFFFLGCSWLLLYIYIFFMHINCGLAFGNNDFSPLVIDCLFCQTYRQQFRNCLGFYWRGGVGVCYGRGGWGGGGWLHFPPL